MQKYSYKYITFVTSFHNGVGYDKFFGWFRWGLTTHATQLDCYKSLPFSRRMKEDVQNLTDTYIKQVKLIMWHLKCANENADVLYGRLRLV